LVYRLVYRLVTGWFTGWFTGWLPGIYRGFTGIYRFLPEIYRRFTGDLPVFKGFPGDGPGICRFLKGLRVFDRGTGRVPVGGSGGGVRFCVPSTRASGSPAPTHLIAPD